MLFHLVVILCVTIFAIDYIEVMAVREAGYT